MTRFIPYRIVRLTGPGLLAWQHPKGLGLWRSFGESVERQDKPAPRVRTGATIVRIRRSLTITVTALALAAAAAACGGTTSKIGSGTAVKGQPLKGGTVTVAQISGTSPNDIFPLTPATNSNGYNLDLTEGEWPSLVYIGDGGKSVVNPKESLYSSLTWLDNDSVITSC